MVLVGPQQLLVLRWHQVHDGGQHVRELSDAARRGRELGRQPCIDRTPLGLDLRQERLDRALLVDNLFKPTIGSVGSVRRDGGGNSRANAARRGRQKFSRARKAWLSCSGGMTHELQYLCRVHSPGARVLRTSPQLAVTLVCTTRMALGWAGCCGAAAPARLLGVPASLLPAASLLRR